MNIYEVVIETRPGAFFWDKPIPKIYLQAFNYKELKKEIKGYYIKNGIRTGRRYTWAFWGTTKKQEAKP